MKNNCFWIGLLCFLSGILLISVAFNIDYFLYDGKMLVGSNYSVCSIKDIIDDAEVVNSTYIYYSTDGRVENTQEVIVYSYPVESKYLDGKEMIVNDGEVSYDDNKKTIVIKKQKKVILDDNGTAVDVWYKNLEKSLIEYGYVCE